MRPAIVLGTNLVVGAAVLVWVLHEHGAPALALLATPPRLGALALFAAAVATAFLVYTRRWQVVLAGLDVRRRLVVLALFRAAGQSVSAVVPSAKLGGEPLRALFLVRGGVPGSSAIASVAVDRTLEMSAAAPFACLYAAFLLRRGVPELEGALVSVLLGATALAAGVVLTTRRLRRGTGLVTAVARSIKLDRIRLVEGQMGVLAAAETDAARLVAQPRRLAVAFATGIVANLLVIAEYHFLLFAFGLPAGPTAVVAAIFAAGAAHSLPVPGAIGALEGAQMWLFGTLGHPPEVGLAVGLAVRLRELVWILPGLLYLMGRGILGWRRGRDYQARSEDRPLPDLHAAEAPRTARRGS